MRGTFMAELIERKVATLIVRKLVGHEQDARDTMHTSYVPASEARLRAVVELATDIKLAAPEGENVVLLRN